MQRNTEYCKAFIQVTREPFSAGGHGCHRALLLDVADNGTGFDPAEHTRGYGLVGMRQRLAGVAGHLTVESAPGTGTTLNVAVPLPRRPDVLVPGAPAEDRQVGATR